MQAAGDLLELLEHAIEPARGLGQAVGQLLLVRWHDRRGGAQLQPERHKSLLSAVVQVALDPAARLVAGGHDPGA